MHGNEKGRGCGSAIVGALAFRQLRYFAPVAKQANDLRICTKDRATSQLYLWNPVESLTLGLVPFCRVHQCLQPPVNRHQCDGVKAETFINQKPFYPNNLFCPQ